jgi:hypothetical protein
MLSFELIYDGEEDALEVTFESFDEHFARTIALNDNVVIHTDTSFSVVWGLTFYSYAQLLQVNETHLDGLEALSDADRRRVLGLLSHPPASHFLEVTTPDDLLARVKAPTLQALLS